MVKCAVFLDNGLLVENQFNDVSIAAAKFAWMFLDMCELSMVFYEGGKLQELLTEIKDGIEKLLEPLVTGKSIERLGDLRKSLSPEFFEYLLKDGDVNEQRSNAGARVLKILEDRKIPRPAQERLETSQVG